MMWYLADPPMFHNCFIEHSTLQSLYNSLHLLIYENFSINLSARVLIFCILFVVNFFPPFEFSPRNVHCKKRKYYRITKLYCKNFHLLVNVLLCNHFYCLSFLWGDNQFHHSWLFQAFFPMNYRRGLPPFHIMEYLIHLMHGATSMSIQLYWLNSLAVYEWGSHLWTTLDLLTNGEIKTQPRIHSLLIY